ncbi:membrane-associated HD superfamily phosphohydrolase [Pseudomonas sp. PvP046]
MKLPLRPSLSRAAILQVLTLIVLIGMLVHQQWQIFHLKAGFESAANLETVNAITRRINGVDDRLDAASQLKSVTIDDFRAGQQALSNRIDAVQALVKQVQEASQDATQQAASMQEVVVMGARIEELQVKLRTCVQLKPHLLKSLLRPSRRLGRWPYLQVRCRRRTTGRRPWHQSAYQPPCR